MLWSTSYPVCVAYTKTIIHKSEGESGGVRSKEESGNSNEGKNLYMF